MWEPAKRKEKKTPEEITLEERIKELENAVKEKSMEKNKKDHAVKEFKKSG